MGFTLMDNFKQPYLAASIQEFWQRWHISLTSWFRDYLYIPLGGNRKGKLIKYRNIMITFLLSGLWHGAAWNYVIWGGLNGIYQITGDLLRPIRNKIRSCLKVNNNCFSYRFGQIVITFLLSAFAFIFFRAESLGSAFRMIHIILSNFKFYELFGNSIFELGLSTAAVKAIIPTLLCLLLVDVAHERNFHFRKWLRCQGLMFRWTTYFISTMIVIIGAVWNLGQSAANFIYFQF